MKFFNQHHDAKANSDIEHANSTSSDQKPQESTLAEIIRFSIIALFVVLPIRWFIAQPFIVSGASMENTFHNNEYLIVDQLTYQFEAPARGDVIIFHYPKDTTKFFIKRIIGLPGETVKIDGDVVTIINDTNPDGIVLDEPYINSMNQPTYLTETLSNDEYFVMGDNRDHSSDSRIWGTLSTDKIVGRAYLRLFPFSKINVLPGSYSTNES